MAYNDEIFDFYVSKYKKLGITEIKSSEVSILTSLLTGHIHD